jgi:hypothetical protein
VEREKGRWRERGSRQEKEEGARGKVRKDGEGVREEGVRVRGERRERGEREASV